MAKKVHQLCKTHTCFNQLTWCTWLNELAYELHLGFIQRSTSSTWPNKHQISPLTWREFRLAADAEPCELPPHEFLATVGAGCLEGIPAHIFDDPLHQIVSVPPRRDTSASVGPGVPEVCALHGPRDPLDIQRLGGVFAVLVGRDGP